MVRIALVSAFALILGACSTVMEYNRPDPVDITQFKPGNHRIDVVKVLGPPLTSVKDGPKSCDVYHLYTHGPNGIGKAGIIFVEGAADFFTLGLSEVVATPLEASTKSSLHPVTMCYGQDDVLLSVEESDERVVQTAHPATDNAAAAPATGPVSAASPEK